MGVEKKKWLLATNKPKETEHSKKGYIYLYMSYIYYYARVIVIQGLYLFMHELYCLNQFLLHN